MDLIRKRLSEIWSTYDIEKFPCARNFNLTAWLFENYQKLSYVTGLSLQSAVINFQQDDFTFKLVAESVSGQKALVQYGLGKSKHSDLGKLITYSTALKNRQAIWVVGKARKGHIKAINEMNQSKFLAIWLVEITDIESKPKLSCVVNP